MPVFNWEDANNPVIKSGFKIYWAFAIPVTFLVLVIWALSLWLPWSKWLSRWTSRRADESGEFYDQSNDTFELL